MCGHCRDALCRTLESTDAVRRFWSALANLHSRARTQNVSRMQHWDYAVVTHRTVLDTAGAFLSDQSGKKYQKPTSRTQDGQFSQQLFSKKCSIDCSKAKLFAIIFSIIAN